jgi:hypothetical protein
LYRLFRGRPRRRWPCDSKRSQDDKRSETERCRPLPLHEHESLSSVGRDELNPELSQGVFSVPIYAPAEFSSERAVICSVLFPCCDSGQQFYGVSRPRTRPGDQTDHTAGVTEACFRTHALWHKRNRNETASICTPRSSRNPQATTVLKESGFIGRSKRNARRYWRRPRRLPSEPW